MDVARRSGYSKSTVSKALNLPPDQSSVGEAARRKIQQAAKELEYRPNWIARALTHRKTHSIGLMYWRDMPIVDAVYRFVVIDLAVALRGKGYHLVFMSEEDAADVILDQRVDGCVMVGPMPASVGELVVERSMPTVLVNARTELPIPQILTDDVAGARMVAEHLLELGHRHITYLVHAQAEHYSVADRWTGCRQAVEDAGAEATLSRSDESMKDFAARLAESSDGPTGVVCYNSESAVELIYRLWRNGLRVPDDLSVVGFNDTFPAAWMIPPLTTVELPTKKMGREAARVVLQQIDGSGPESPECITLQERLIVRGSTAAPTGG